MRGEVEYMNSTKKRGFIAAEEYKNIAEEAVLDRKMVLLQLKRVQDQWSPSESFNSIQQQVFISFLFLFYYFLFLFISFYFIIYLLIFLFNFFILFYFILIIYLLNLSN